MNSIAILLHKLRYSKVTIVLKCCTDSTYIPGLLKVLERIAQSQLIGTVIPGRLYTAQSSVRTGLELRLTTTTKRTTSMQPGSISLSNTVSVPTGSMSQKVVARSLSGVQEVNYSTLYYLF